MTRFWLAFVMVLALGANAPATADSWPPPKVQTYASSNGQYRFTVFPRGITGPLGYFQDKVEGKEPAGQRSGTPTVARGVLERRVGDGWQTVWVRPLVNDVSPVEALVSPGGGYVVTFDNWHSMGWGDDVVVIYGRDGTLVRHLGLEDILPKTYVETLPRSVSSIHWRGDGRIAGSAVFVEVVVPGDDADNRYIDVRIDLATGRVQLPSGKAWDAALAAVAEVSKVQAAERAEYLAELRRPLVAPADTDTELFAWERYMFEAFRRVAPDWDGTPPFPLSLSRPSDEDYAQDLDLFIGVLEEGETDSGGADFVVASSDQANMTAVLTAAAPRLANGKLAGKTIYLFVGDANWEVLKVALAPTGAKLVQIDPSRPIPQRPERLTE
ncbi:MAG: hypothetical protein Q8L66_12820 [Caulobacter sp.]|nr:hypothetical protein [Caulobacter sp.]